MKIKDYEKADCGLYRTPIFDSTELEKEVTRLLMQAWRQGDNAGAAVNGVFQNRELLERLTGELSKSLSYQRRSAVEKVETLNEENLLKHKQQLEIQLKEQIQL